MSKALLLMSMWLCSGSTITLWILPPRALWTIGIIQSATQLQISHCEDGMHWLDGWSRMCIVGGNCSGTLEGGRMGDNLEIFAEVLGPFFMFCLFNYYIGHIHAWRVVLRVHDVGINHWDSCFWAMNAGSDRTPSMGITLATTLVSIRNTRVFQTALMAPTEPRTLGPRIRRFPSPCWRAALRTYLLYFAPAMWWCIHAIRTTRVVHSSQGLQLCCSRSHNGWRCLCLFPAKCHILPLSYCYILDAALSPYTFSFEILWLITIQSLLRIHRLPLHLLSHYLILQVWNILSNLHTF